MSQVVVVALGGGGALIVVVAAAARRPGLIVWGLAALGGAYAGWLPKLSGAELALATPLSGGGLLMVAEAAFYGAERGQGSEYRLRQIAWMVLTGLAGMAISAAALLAATLPVERSPVLTIGGTLAAVLAVALPSAGLRRRHNTQR